MLIWMLRSDVEDETLSQAVSVGQREKKTILISQRKTRQAPGNKGNLSLSVAISTKIIGNK